ncbi:hypothetical protein [uncultured Polaribacter sp.]|uniref:hypothetical protein n=1 Tax=uncultured Polaribacter sp. TaxID=174711 RepID=UPI002609EEC6|nr:hypothetical protein [uncultured Polaribacter sp.]
MKKIFNLLKGLFKKREDETAFDFYTFTDLFIKSSDSSLNVFHSKTYVSFLTNLNEHIGSLAIDKIVSCVPFNDKIAIETLDVGNYKLQEIDWCLLEVDFGFLDKSRVLMTDFSLKNLNFFDLPKNLIIIIHQDNIYKTLDECMLKLKEKYNTNNYSVNAISLSEFKSKFEKISLFVNSF